MRFSALIKEKLVASNGKDNLMLCGDFSYRRWLRESLYISPWVRVGVDIYQYGQLPLATAGLLLCSSDTTEAESLGTVV